MIAIETVTQSSAAIALVVMAWASTRFDIDLLRRSFQLCSIRVDRGARSC
jgi:hypothetical protein